MELKKSIIVNKSIEDTWDLLGNNFGDAYKWASELYHSEASGTPKIEGAVCNNRTCDTSWGNIQEEILQFDSKQYILEYEVIEGFPGFMKKGANKWTLSRAGINQTKVETHFRGETQGIMGTLMKPMMKMKLNKTLEMILKDFKYYLENGKPSPAKLKDMEKHGTKMAA